MIRHLLRQHLELLLTENPNDTNEFEDRFFEIVTNYCDIEDLINSQYGHIETFLKDVVEADTIMAVWPDLIGD